VTIESELAQAPQLLRDFLDQRGLVYDPQAQVDMLASAVACQFVLFAGPSGTGKSTAAKVLAEFLAPTSRHATLDARPAWTASEDVAGQYSAFTDQYVAGPFTADLVRLDGGTGTPVVIVEEANLSPIEAYAGPVITAASSIAFERLPWVLHNQPPGGKSGIPAEVLLGPWPRVFGTVNVDSTADAPAPKVSGRACVVLLEPPDVDTALKSTDAITPSPAMAHAGPPGQHLFGDPTKAWASYLVAGKTDRFSDALKPLLTVLADSAGRKSNLVSPRDVQRCVVFMSWHAPLAEAAVAAKLLASSNDTESAENSLLHFVLPGLSSEQFGRALMPLLNAATPDGLLARRLTKLAAGGESLFGVSPDFWASLS